MAVVEPGAGRRGRDSALHASWTRRRSRARRSWAATSRRSSDASWEDAEYRGEPGLCPLCHLSVIELVGTSVACATCGARGELTADLTVPLDRSEPVGDRHDGEARALRRDPGDRPGARAPAPDDRRASRLVRRLTTAGSAPHRPGDRPDERPDRPARHRRAPPRAGRHRRGTAAAVVGVAHRPARAGGRPPTSWRSSPRTATRGRPAGSTPRSRCSVPWGAPALDQPRPPDGAGPASGARAPRSRRRGARTSSSRPGCWTPADWSAELVQPRAAEAEHGGAGASLLRREFSPGPARRPRPALRHRARRLRGRAQRRRVGDHVLAPGWTSYDHRLRYQTYDVTDLLAEGAQRDRRARWPTAGTAATLGFGGKRERLRRPHSGCLAQLEVDHADGSRTVVTTDGSLALGTRAGDPGRTSTTARPTTPALEQPGWSTAGLRRRGVVAGRASGRWTRRRWSPRPGRRCGARRRCPVAGDQRPRRRARRSSTSGRTWSAGCGSGCRTARPAPRSPLRHAEVLEDGELGIRPLRKAAADRPSSSCAATARETWEPRFTFHGFRYAEVDRLAGRARPQPTSRRSSCTPTCARTGWFTCSDPRREPAARERRLGHARQLRRRADRLPAARRAARLDRRHRRCSPRPRLPLRHAPACSRSWLADLAVEQPTHDGVVPIFVPYADDHAAGLPAAAATAGWGDAAVVVPWVLYQRLRRRRAARRPVGRA